MGIVQVRGVLSEFHEFWDLNPSKNDIANLKIPLLFFSVSYRVDMTKSPPDVQVLRETEIPGFDRSHYNVEQVFYNSKDGTRVPMFIASRKDLKRDGSEPCMLYGKNAK